MVIAPFYGTQYGTIPPRWQAGIRCIGAENSGIRRFRACDAKSTRLAAGAFFSYAARLRLARMAARAKRRPTQPLRMPKLSMAEGPPHFTA